MLFNQVIVHNLNGWLDGWISVGADVVAKLRITRPKAQRQKLNFVVHVSVTGQHNMRDIMG